MPATATTTIIPAARSSMRLTQVEPGNAIKLAAGSYDVSGIDVENLLIGKEGVRGGYSAEDHFAIQNAETNPTRDLGRRRRLPQQLHRAWLHRGGRQRRSAAAHHHAEDCAAPTACTNGLAGTFPCHNIDYLAPGPAAGNSRRARPARSEIWGLVDLDDGREYAILGHRNGTAFYDVTNPGAPVLVANIPGNQSLWREVKAYQVFDAALGRHRAYAYATTEAPGGGLQIFDLTDLPNSVTLANTLTQFSTSHTLYISNINYATNAALPGATPYLFIAGANIGGGAFRIYDLTNPASPTLVTPPPAGTGYMHDSTSMLITDNRTTQCANAHNPCQVLVDFNETSVDLWDVTDKAAPVRLSTTTYPTATYVHSGWPTADNMFIVVHDELDELRAASTRISTRSTSPTCARRASSPRTSAARPPPITTATRSAIATTFRTTNAAS